MIRIPFKVRNNRKLKQNRMSYYFNIDYPDLDQVSGTGKIIKYESLKSED